MGIVLGIDLATSGVKCLVLDENAQMLAVAFQPYPLDTSEPDKAEQGPEHWWNATCESIKRAIAQSNRKPVDVKAIGLTGQMHGLVLLDESGTVIRPAMIWLDSRSSSQCQWVKDTIGEDKVVELTCNLPLTGFTAPKLLWVRDNEPENYQRIRTVLLPKDYIRYRMTGEKATDVSDASGTMLFDVAKRTWSTEMIELLDFSPGFFPQAYESIEITGTLLPGIANELGIDTNVPVIAGAGDQAAAAISCGAFEEGVLVANIGSGGIIFLAMDSPKIDPTLGLHTFCHAIPDKWHFLGVVQTAGLALRWFRDTFGQEEEAIARSQNSDVYDILVQKASGIAAGCDGLVFLPYLMGERSPHRDPFARGVFFGASLHHHKGYFIRALLEGVAYAMRDCVESARNAGVQLTKYYTGSSGGYQAQLWRGIQADILGADLISLKTVESSACGAAILAGAASGLYEDIQAIQKNSTEELWHTRSDHERAGLYDNYYNIYRKLYVQLKSVFQETAQLKN